MLEGEMMLTVDSETWSLKTGDSFRFASRRPHRFSNPANDAERRRAVGELCDGGGLTSLPSFRGASKRRTRNLEIPGSMLRIAPE